MDLRAVFIDFMLRFCDIFSQNSALALKFALRMLTVCPRTRLQHCSHRFPALKLKFFLSCSGNLCSQISALLSDFLWIKAVNQ